MIGVTISILGIIIIATMFGIWFKTARTENITIRGSTTVLPIAQKVAEVYMEDHPNVFISVSGGGSSVGIQSVGEGIAEIGMASRDLKDEEKSRYPNLKPIVIAKDAITIIVHPDNPITTLTLEQIRGIYNGTYTNWKEVGGPDQEIVVINRDSASGTREFFWEHVMHKDDFVATAIEKNSNGAVKQTVSQTPNAIGYVGLGYLDSSVKAIKIKMNGAEIEPTVANVLNGKYPIARSLYMITNGEPKGLVKDFIAFVLSEEGQRIVEEEGFVPIK
ncbi:MAG: phosphate ABC transporter substrate-binding protein [Candidatus Heimdallarchaeaceae archaeon]